tara:strand:+ start:213 stop:341 length:129 start_codon:yes stop_codon:yes gene_type:complete
MHEMGMGRSEPDRGMEFAIVLRAKKNDMNDKAPIVLLLNILF